MASKAFSVSQLSGYIKGMFEDELILHNISVYGEIEQFNVSSSNTFISLKENNSFLNCMRFGVTEAFKKGCKVILFGTLKFYSKTSKLTFVFKEIKYYGEGEEHAKFLALKNKLKSEGLFENPLAMPKFINRAAIITSETGAVIHDFISVLHESSACEIKLFSVNVQGEYAVNQIIDALALAQTEKFDIIVLARGGGSSSDLSIFNDENLSRKVSQSRIPIISAIGHETDYSLCDLCSSVRAGTPSIAAKIIADINGILINKMFSLSKSLWQNLQKLFLAKQQKVVTLGDKTIHFAQMHLMKSSFEIEQNAYKLKEFSSLMIENKMRRLNLKCKNLISSSEGLTVRKQGKIETIISSLENNNPIKILKQGYSKIYYGDKIVSSVKNLREGNQIKAVMSDGSVTAKIISTEKFSLGDEQ